jgi:hypothetical protein
MQAGGSGVSYGRNVWQREWPAALEVIEQIKEIMLSSSAGSRSGRICGLARDCARRGRAG